jgi:hypothetical protein
VVIWAPPQFGRWRGKNVISKPARCLLLKSKAMSLIFHLSRVTGVFLGVAAGYLFGPRPPECVRHGIKFSLRWTDSVRLKQRLRQEPGLAPIIIEEFVSRGEPVGQCRDFVESLLTSDSFMRRSCGKECRKKWFPNLTPQRNAFETL